MLPSELLANGLGAAVGGGDGSLDQLGRRLRGRPPHPTGDAAACARIEDELSRGLDDGSLDLRERDELVSKEAGDEDAVRAHGGLVVAEDDDDERQQQVDRRPHGEEKRREVPATREDGVGDELPAHRPREAGEGRRGWELHDGLGRIAADGPEQGPGGRVVGRLELHVAEHAPVEVDAAAMVVALDPAGPDGAARRDEPVPDDDPTRLEQGVHPAHARVLTQERQNEAGRPQTDEPGEPHVSVHQEGDGAAGGGQRDPDVPEGARATQKDSVDRARTAHSSSVARERREAT